MGVSPADRLAILELVVQLYGNLDSGDVEAVVAHFTEDGCFSHPEASVPRDRLAALLTDWFEQGREVSSLHVPGNPIFAGEDESDPILRMVVTKYRLAPPTFVGASDLTLVARKVDGDWKIARFEIAGRGEGA